MKKIAIVDYGMGNVQSIANAIEKLHATPILTSDENIILEADALILPGVGAFGKAMENLVKYDIVSTINKFIATGKPFMGICLGMQLLLDESEEFGVTKGLGLIQGNVIKLPIPESAKEKLPHVSWNEIVLPSAERWDGTILEGMEKPDVYFVHTFVANPVNKADILTETVYGDVTFCSAIQKNNIYGVQFHPEKSGEIGLKMLDNFIKKA